MTNFKSRLLKLFIPIMLSNLINQVQMLIDRIFLGRVDVLFMSAVGNASNLLWTSMSFVFSLSIGASIIISQAVGEGNEKKVQEYAGALLKWHNIIPLFLFFFWMFFSPLVFTLMGVSDTVREMCVTYTRFYAPVFLIIGFGSSFIVIMQTSNHTKHLVWYGLIRSVVNIVLDYVLIFGKWGFPEMGIAGAALATTIAEYAGMGFGAIIFINSKHLTTRPSFSSIIKSKITPYLKSVRLGVNTALEDFTWNFGNLGIIRILNTINELAAGIYSIVFSIECLAVVIIGALGNATMTLCGETTGARDEVHFKKIVKTSYLWSSIVSATLLLSTIFFPKQLLGIFTTDAEIIQKATLLLVLIGINMFSKSANIIVGNGIRGYGDPKWMFYTQIFGTVFVLCAASAFVFGLKMGIAGVYCAVLCDEFIRAIINTARFSRIRFDSATAA